MSSLRLRAEEIIGRKLVSPAPAPADIHHLFHELQIHQAELEIQNDELQRARDEAEAALSDQQRIYGALSHDMAQPVFALRLFVQSLSEGALTADQRNLVAQIASSANALGEISAALTGLCNDVRNGLVARPQRIALGPLLESALNDHLPIADKKGLRVRLVPTLTNGVTDPAQLRRIVGNLIANAVQHTHAGSILIGVRRSGGDDLRIEVRDTGPGIPLEAQARIFDEFYQVGNTERNPARGYGLGLAIARRLADNLGLKLGVRSAVGEGSIFSVTLSRRVTAKPSA